MKRSKGRRKRLKCKVDLAKAGKLVKQHPASRQLADVVRALLWLGAPKLFCQLVWIIGARCTDDETLGKVDVIELFAGKRAICRAAVERGLRALPCEIDDDKIYMDMVGPQGLTREALVGAPALQALDSQTAAANSHDESCGALGKQLPSARQYVLCPRSVSCLRIEHLQDQRPQWEPSTANKDSYLPSSRCCVCFETSVSARWPLFAAAGCGSIAALVGEAFVLLLARELQRSTNFGEPRGKPLTRG